MQVGGLVPALAACLLTGCSVLFAPGEAGGQARDAAAEAECLVDDECPGGRCEPDQRCSVYDEACPSGRRYASGGPAVACVEPCTEGSFGEAHDAFDIQAEGYVLGGVSADETVMGGVLVEADGRWIAAFVRESHGSVSGDVGAMWKADPGEDVVFLAHDGDTVYLRQTEADGAFRVGGFSGGDVSSPIPGIGTTEGVDLWVSVDGLRAYLSTGAADKSLVLLDRPNTTSPFTTQLSYPVSGVESFALSSDELELIYAVPVEGRGLDLYRTVRDDRAASFAEGRALAELNSLDDDHLPALAADGLTLYFQRTRLGTDDGPLPKRAPRTCAD